MTQTIINFGSSDGIFCARNAYTDRRTVFRVQVSSCRGPFENHCRPTGTETNEENEQTGKGHADSVRQRQRECVQCKHGEWLENKCCSNKGRGVTQHALAGCSLHRWDFCDLFCICTRQCVQIQNEKKTRRECAKVKSTLSKLSETVESAYGAMRDAKVPNIKNLTQTIVLSLNGSLQLYTAIITY